MGLRVEIVTGSSMYDYVQITEAGRPKSMVAQAMKTEKTVRYEIAAVGPHGSQATYSVRMCPIKSGGRVKFLSLLAHDITPRTPASATGRSRPRRARQQSSAR